MRPRKKIVLRCQSEITESILRFVLESTMPVRTMRECDPADVMLGCAIVVGDTAAVVELSRYMPTIELVPKGRAYFASLAHHTVALDNMVELRARIKIACARLRGPKKKFHAWNYDQRRVAA